VVFGNQQQALGVRADAVDQGHRRLYAKRQEAGVEVVEAAREKIHVDRRQLETRIAQVDRSIEGRRVFLPLPTQPAFDRRHGIEETALDLEQGTAEGSGKAWNHELVSSLRRQGMPVNARY
jgi:hypothetical protein